MANVKEKINITPKEASMIFRVANNLADMMENVLEAQGKYRTEFLYGLKLSIGQAKSGNLKKISSLKEI